MRTFWVLFVLTLLTIVGMQITGAPLKTAAAPAGIVSFEFAGSLQSSQAMIDSWQGEAMLWAGINMGLDFLFLFLYSITIALGCLIVSRSFGDQWPVQRTLGIYLSRGVLLAGILDIIENIALVRLLAGSQNDSLPFLAKWMAIPKFILVIFALIYVIPGMFMGLKPKRVGELS